MKMNQNIFSQNGQGNLALVEEKLKRKNSEIKP